MGVSLALYQPDIPQNTGTLIRLGACLGAPVHIIHPTGFVFSDKNLRRAAMDYAETASVIEHDSFAAFDTWRTVENRRLVLLTTKTSGSAYDFAYQDHDVLLLGRESAGVPEAVADTADARIRIPMRPDVRSINVALAGALVLGEALRQTNALASLS
ncbi:tRNA (cytidine(34)-2'-O)-methyltransferase [Cucumibacter marinus]|uniref:tRNA (cytidine(34)-2'-O)-methyltransferase n=1 Tax=Cucumibacter marinus TaxID=1121252 RepID=UPI0004095D6D|nr:tRNA (cytidine(34)-2'-O)-methyltransferase [Cucumibacter marinus]